MSEEKNGGFTLGETVIHFHGYEPYGPPVPGVGDILKLTVNGDRLCVSRMQLDGTVGNFEIDTLAGRWILIDNIQPKSAIVDIMKITRGMCK